jgi:protein-L-isoaspartate(D-aspartate) O-methyltransferase
VPSPPAPRSLRAAGLALVVALCGAGAARAAEPASEPADPREPERLRMVAEQIEARGVADPRVLAALRSVPRHLFVPPERAADAYADQAVAIGHGATISQPYVVAVMTEQAAVEPGEKALEVGTGSGYQAALLAALGAEVYTIEIVEPLARRAEQALRRAGHAGVHVRAGDGYRGWPEAAPFDAILVTAAAPRVPQPLLDQLAVGGRLVIPVDVEGGAQELQVHERDASGVTVRPVLGVRFVPMTGEVRAPAERAPATPGDAR